MMALPISLLLLFFSLFLPDLPYVGSCLQCDRLVQFIHDDFLEMHIQNQPSLKKVIDQAYVNYRLTSQHFQGVIDASTLYRARTEYQSEFHKFLNTPRQEKDLVFELIQVVEKGRGILEKHLKGFIETGLCPNTCGLMYQRVMNCSSCHPAVRTCVSPTAAESCGVYRIQVPEGGQAVLNCFLPWHSLTMGKAEYQYSWAPNLTASSEGDFEVVIATPDARVVLNQVRMEEGGVYRCLLLSTNGTILTRILFLLRVTSLPPTSPLPVRTLPSLPPDNSTSPPTPVTYSAPVVRGWVAAVTAGSAAACVGVLAAFGKGAVLKAGGLAPSGSV
ncbi:izumo sperm-egg fusion protein 1 isoform X2 [Lepisosteus oculatus]|uniref:izumo sperm-egg fusion protein 1 isoform X2 n=1 Tax=Lepisosteus oculatus TaxID=7918 RepID=UPI0035F50048